MTIFNAARTTYSLLSSVNRQHRFITCELAKVLEDAKMTNDGSLDESDFKKITHYYGLAVPAILGDALCDLRGNSMTEKERKALTYQGAMTGLFDDFFDKFDMSDELVMSLLEKPDEIKAKNSVEKLFLHFYKKALQHSHDPSLVLHYLSKVYAVQVESKKQSIPGLSEDEILDITLRKGGVSVLFYRAALSHPFVDGEEEALKNMGGLMQFGNDIFDIYKDRNTYINTLLTTAVKIKNVRQLFVKQMNRSFKLTNSLSYKPTSKKKYLRRILMSLCSRCFVCLDQLEQNEQMTDSIFKIDQYSRAQLVCDMDKNSNKWQTVRYYIKHNF